MAVKKVYIVADIEGIAGGVFYEHFYKEMSHMNYEMLHRNRVLLTEEVNAAARGAFAAGAVTVFVHDCHGRGYTILPDMMHKHIELIHGRPDYHVAMLEQHPGLDESFDAMVLIGMHAKAGTREGCTPHSLICVTDGNGNNYELSEAGCSAAVAGAFGVPCAFVAGDAAVVEEMENIIPNIGATITKHCYAPQLCRTITPELSREKIENGVMEAMKNISLVKPFVIPGECVVQIADRNPKARWPEHPEKCADFLSALQSAYKNVPWYKLVEKIDDGWRYPDRTYPCETPNDKWNDPLTEKFIVIGVISIPVGQPPLKRT